jgi:hypothetical protein
MMQISLYLQVFLVTILLETEVRSIQNAQITLNASLKLSNSTFDHNIADQGGAIFYDSYRPKLTEIIFDNNTAIYGNNIASYAVSIKPVGSENDLLQLK